MLRPISIARHAGLHLPVVAAVLVVVVLVLAGCQGQSQPQGQGNAGAGAGAGAGSGAGSGAGTGSGSGLPNPPAVTQPSPTPVPPTPAPPTGGPDSWPVFRQTVQGITYSYHYPLGWTSDLAYCVPGSATNEQGSQLSKGCVSTDLLVGKKAKDVGPIMGTPLTLAGKKAVRQVDDHPINPEVARIYTVMLYDEQEAPLIGFSTSFGPGTDPAAMDQITSTLDAVLGTLTVEVGK